MILGHLDSYANGIGDMTDTVVPHNALWAQLAKVAEPCSLAMGNPMSICDMGLVEELAFERGVVRVVLCLTDPACVNYSKICAYVTDVLKDLAWVERVEIAQTTRVLWTPDRVTSPPAPKPVRIAKRMVYEQRN